MPEFAYEYTTDGCGGSVRIFLYTVPGIAGDNYIVEWHAVDYYGVDEHVDILIIGKSIARKEFDRVVKKFQKLQREHASVPW
jgi:hypothetical protein